MDSDIIRNEDLRSLVRLQKQMLAAVCALERKTDSRLPIT
jgi:hypothetical protein